MSTVTNNIRLVADPELETSRLVLRPTRAEDFEPWAAMMADEELILPEHITLNTSASIADLLNKEMTLKEFEIQILQHYLDKYDKDVLLVAKKLDVGKSTLYRMIQNGELKMK